MDFRPKSSFNTLELCTIALRRVHMVLAWKKKNNTFSSPDNALIQTSALRPEVNRNILDNILRVGPRKRKSFMFINQLMTQLHWPLWRQIMEQASVPYVSVILEGVQKPGSNIGVLLFFFFNMAYVCLYVYMQASLLPHLHQAAAIRMLLGIKHLPQWQSAPHSAPPPTPHLHLPHFPSYHLSSSYFLSCKHWLRILVTFSI